MVSYPSIYLAVNSGEQGGELLMVFPLLTAPTATLYFKTTRARAGVASRSLHAGQSPVF